jgi:hypothetical protein
MEEEYERHGVAVAGAADILQQFALRLAAAADMPVTLLMGQSPSGLGATGDSDIRFFYDRIAARQKRSLLPQLKRLHYLIMKSKQGPCEGVEPEQWSIVFNPLYQMSELDQATMRKTVAETDAIYIGQGVLSAEEVAASVYGGSEWTMERTIDMAGREATAEQDAVDQEEAKKAKGALLEQHMKNAAAPQPSVVVAPKKDETDPVSKADELDTVMRALKTAREAGVEMDDAKVRAQFPDLPIKRVIEGDE